MTSMKQDTNKSSCTQQAPSAMINIQNSMVYLNSNYFKAWDITQLNIVTCAMQSDTIHHQAVTIFKMAFIEKH
jgi:hypothetical protein